MNIKYLHYVFAASMLAAVTTSLSGCKPDAPVQKAAVADAGVQPVDTPPAAQPQPPAAPVPAAEPPTPVPAPVASSAFVQPAAVDGFNKVYKAKLKPPAGAKVAVIVFEDLGCPSCAANHATELKAVEQTHVPLIRYDFPFPEHIWTFEGAVCARYIQDNISPKLAGDFRTDVFAQQRLIASKDDIDKYLRSWLDKHGQKAPFVIDPSGKLAKEVGEDYQFGVHLNVQYTPTIIVVTKEKYQVVFGTKDGPNDARRLMSVIQAAQASGTGPMVKK